MLESTLLHLNDSPCGEQAIEIGVNLARRHRARLRGLTLLDTRSLESVLVECEAAVHASSEFHSLNQCERDQEVIRTRFCQACLTAGVDFDLRSVRGDPFVALSREGRFHDLVIAGCPPHDASREARPAGSLNAMELVDLVVDSGQPTMIVRGLDLQRVLMVCDGSPASSRAIRFFQQQNLFPNAECRLLAVGETGDKARELLREMVPYCRSREESLEVGVIQGQAQRVVVPYAQKWKADLILLGVNRRSRVLRRLFGETARHVLTKTSCSLFAVG